jgi:cell division protein FtsQ
VLPRILRKPARQFSRLLQQGTLFSARAIAVLGLAALAGGGGLWLAHSGQGQALVAQSSAWMGFRIADVEITGIKEVSRIDVLTHIDLGAERSLFSFDVHAARQSLRDLPWVSEARVAKAYPDKLVVEIVERSPFAVWQNNGELWLVERDGKKIAPFEERFAGLPLIVGDGAGEGAAAFIAEVKRHPEVAALVKAHVRVGARRWNLSLENGVTVLLPENREDVELATLARHQREFGILERDIAEIDLRASDRMIVRLTPDAAARLNPPEAKTVEAGRDT